MPNVGIEPTLPEGNRILSVALATSAAPIQKRVYSAALALHTLSSDSFEDDELKITFSALNDMLTWQETDADEGTFRATTARFSDEQAVAIAETIFRLYVGLTFRR